MDASNDFKIRNWPKFEIVLLFAALVSVFLGQDDSALFNIGFGLISFLSIYFIAVRPVLVLSKQQHWLLASSLMLGVSLVMAGLCYYFTWSNAFGALGIIHFIFLVVFALKNTILEKVVYSQCLVRHFLVIFILIALQMH
ncbi:MAG: hypothetical protein WBG71_04170 [Leeuwenhoekiella sp.]